MTQVQGMRRYVDTVPTEQQHCASMDGQLQTEGWAVPSTGSWWLCSRASLTPCLTSLVLISSKEWCIQVIIVPKVKYGNITTFTERYNSMDHPRAKREVITSINVSTGRTGRSQNRNCSYSHSVMGLFSLKAAILKDLSEVRTSIIRLEKSHSSLVEGVLQNRRGLNLVFFNNKMEFARP